MSAPLIGIPPKGTEKKKETQEDQFKKLNEKIHITRDISEITDLCVVPETNFLFGGLNLIYGTSESGKSWQTSTAIKNSNCNNYYLDTDGSNGQQFADHCLNNNVDYISSDAIDNFLIPGPGVNLWYRIQGIIEWISKTMTLRKNVIVIDSLTSIAEGLGINNAEEISDPLYKLNKLAAKYDIAIIMIDHATVGKAHDEGFKLEGNAGAKKRTTVTVNRYTPVNPKQPEKGGVFKCERARGNSSNLKINTIHEVHSKTIDDALKFIIKRKPDIKTIGIPQTEVTNTTKHNRDKWARSFIPLLCNYAKEDENNQNSATIVTLKEKYLKQINQS